MKNKKSNTGAAGRPRGKSIRGRFYEWIMRGVFLIAALTSVIAVLLICVFLFASGIPAMAKIGVFDFLLGTK